MRLFSVGVWSMSATLATVGTLTSFSLRSRPSSEHAPVSMAAAADTVELVVGDTLSSSRGLGRGRATTTTTYGSSNASIVSVTGTGGLTALRTGTASITVTATPGQSTIIIVIVRTRQQATNMLVSEVCANVDDNFFMDNLPLSSNLPRIHEYHDCQRLIDKGAYSAVIGIFASTNVATYQSASDYSDGHLAAIIVNFVGRKGSRRYDPLGLMPGTNCLIVRWFRRRWEAAVVPQAMPIQGPSGLHYGDCPDGLTWNDVPLAQQGKLSVLPQSGVDFMNRAIAPPVARWDWDPTNRNNYIGVMCGAAAWCEIGPPGFVRSPPRPFAAGGPAIFKGYYDEQYLADSTGSQPSTVFGTILPGHDAADKSQMAAHNPTVSYETATMRLRETAPAATRAFAHYKQVFYAQPVPMGPPLIAISDLHLTPHIDRSGYSGTMHGSALAADAIRFTGHSGYFAVPTVRWRWKARDEGMWTYCDPDGCCEYGGIW